MRISFSYSSDYSSVYTYTVTCLAAATKQCWKWRTLMLSNWPGFRYGCVL